MKMRGRIGKTVLLAGACMMTVAAWAQQPAAAHASWKPAAIDLAVTYSAELAQQTVSSNSFWLQGGGVDAVATYRNGLGISVAFNGERISNVAVGSMTTGADLNKITFLAGPRYTVRIGSLKQGKEAKPLAIFAEGLFGDVHAFNTVIPSSSGVKSSADAFALQAGGGFNLRLTQRIGVRLAQIDYVRTTLPNNGSDVQNDLRVGCGIIFHLRKR